MSQGGCLGCIFFLGDRDRPGPCIIFPGAWLTAIHRCPARVAREAAPAELVAALARGEVPDALAHPPLPGPANPNADCLAVVATAMDRAERQLDRLVDDFFADVGELDTLGGDPPDFSAGGAP